MIKTEFLVPVRDNDGNPFDAEDWDELEQQIVQLIGVDRGYSREEGIQGVWFWEGVQYRDRSSRYILALDSWEELPAWLDLLRWVQRRFRQLAIYYEVAGIPGLMRSGAA